MHTFFHEQIPWLVVKEDVSVNVSSKGMFFCGLKVFMWEITSLAH